MAGYHSNQQHGGRNGENGDHNPGLGESHPFFWYVHMWVCECYVNYDPHNTVEHICDGKSIQQLCLWTRLIKTRMWHHLCSLYVSFERQLVEKQTTAARSWDEIQKRISGWGNPNKYINTYIHIYINHCFCGVFFPQFVIIDYKAEYFLQLGLVCIYVVLTKIQESFPEKRSWSSAKWPQNIAGKSLVLISHPNERVSTQTSFVSHTCLP